MSERGSNIGCSQILLVPRNPTTRSIGSYGVGSGLAGFRFTIKKAAASKAGRHSRGSLANQWQPPISANLLFNFRNQTF